MYAPIYNPNPRATPATEILLSDRLLTNEMVTDFFNNIPERIKAIENATAVSGELELAGMDERINILDQYLDKTMENVGDISEEISSIYEIIGYKNFEQNIYELLTIHNKAIYGDTSSSAEGDQGLEEFTMSNYSMGLKNEKAIKNLTNQNTSEHTAINTRITQVENRVTTNEIDANKLESVETAVEQLQSKVKAFDETKLDEYYKKVDNVKNTVDDNVQRLSTIETLLKDEDGNLKINTIELYLDSVESRLSELETKIKQLEGN